MSKSLESQLSAEHVEELKALRFVDDTTGRKTMLFRSHLREGAVADLVSQGLAECSEPTIPFPRVGITAKGRALLTRLEASEPEQ